ncbi:MAG: acyltransferase [Chloroflexales bacterium]
MEAQQPQPTPAPRTAPPHLDALDGIRCLAALYVAVYHATGNAGYAGYTPQFQSQLSTPMLLLVRVLDFGIYAVPIFIVLSGFCLMLPLARRNTLEIPGGVIGYLSRRAWRILPAYYVTLFLSLGLIALVPMLQVPLGTAWDTKIPVTLGAFFSHLFLLHDFHTSWIYKINGPMWSIAIEWQIYFLFPAVLLPLLRRTNIVVTVIVATVVGMLPHFLLPIGRNLDDSHFWFVGLFAMGMGAALIAFSDDPRLTAYRTRVPWRAIGAVLVAGLLATMALERVWLDQYPFICDPLIGLAVMSWLVRYGVVLRQGGKPLLIQRLAEAPALVKLGTFSYSIYLIHSPIQALVNVETLRVPMSTDARLALQICVVTPLAVFCAYLFYLVVERPSIQLNERRRAALLHAPPI